MSTAQIVFRNKRLFDVLRLHVTSNRKRLFKLHQPGVSIAWGKFLLAILEDPLVQNFLDYWDLGCVWWVYQCHRIEILKPRRRVVISNNPHQPRRTRYELEEGFDTQEWINSLPIDPYTYQVTTSTKRSISEVDR